MKSLLSESGTDVVLLKTESKERAYVDTLDTDLSRTFRIPDEKPSVVLLKTESKERAYVDTLGTDLSRTFQIPDEKPSGLSTLSIQG